MQVGGDGLRLVRGPSLEALADALADELVVGPPGDDPFAAVEVVVPSRGVERWLAQQLSVRLGAEGGEAGVCAGVAFPFLGGVIARVVAAMVPSEDAADDPWSPQRLVWPLAELLDDLPSDPALAPLRAHLIEAGELLSRRRFPLARRIADLFDRYALYRPDMVAAWRRGEDVDGDQQPLADHLAWQPPLWRLLAEQLGADGPDQRLDRAIGRLRDQQPLDHTTGLPRSLSVFGVLALPPRHLALLDALGTRVPVTMFALAPCPTWSPSTPVPEPRNRLLAASGVFVRDAHTILAEHLGGARSPGGEPGGATGPTSAPSVLRTLQADIRSDIRRGEDAEPSIHPAGDRSVQVHACHGAVRQLEVLRETLLGLLEEDRSLEPRDIVVMTPEIEAYAPIVPAVFASGEDVGDQDGHAGPPDLPVRVADRALTEDNPVAKVLTTVLELSAGRVGASEVLDLLSSGPVRARFDLSAADLETLPAWLHDGGVSWGIDAEHRRELIDLDDGAHTWSSGLDRWTLGAAMADDGTRMVGGVVPYDEVEGAAVGLLGRVTAATDHLFLALRTLRDPRPIAAWQAAFAGTVTALCDPGPGTNRDAALVGHLAEVRAGLEDLVADARTEGGRSSPVELTLEEVRGLLGERLGARTGRASYGSGSITFTGLVPLRNVPHRVVCLVGMDDGAVPRKTERHGFDLLETPSRPGDPDPRLEDRQLVLDAILAARDHLVVTYTGHDPRTNEVQQPAVPISELLEVIDRSVRFVQDGEAGDAGNAPGTPAVRRARDRVLCTHPLQPHSPRYFRPALPGEGSIPRAFDRRHLAGARARVTARGQAPPFLTARLAPPPNDPAEAGVVELDDLVRFLEHPVRFLLQRRLGLSLGEDDRRLEDRDPLELDGLERWKLGQDLLGRQLVGAVHEHWREVTLATGTVPVGGLGTVALEGIEALVERLVTRVEQLGAGEELVPVDLAIDLGIDPSGAAPEPVRLVGSVALRGDHVVHVGVSAPKAKHQVATWVRLLAASAARGDLRPRARLIGGDKDGPGGVRELELDPSGTAAAEHLGALVALYLDGHQAALPVLPETARAYTAALRDGRTPEQAVGHAHHRAWVGNRRFGGERDDAYVVQAFGSETELADVVASYPFASAAERIWRPLLDAEVAL